MRSATVHLALCMAVASVAISAGAAAQRVNEPAATGRDRIANQRAQRDLNGKLPARDASVPGAAALKSGVYVLSLSPSVIDGRSAPKAAQPSVSNVTVVSTASAISVTSDAGAALHGATHGQAFNVSGQSGEGTLALNGTTANNAATGSFTMKMNGGHVATGKFTLSSTVESGLTAKSMKLKEYVAPKAAAASSCNWWCTFKGWIGL